MKQQLREKREVYYSCTRPLYRRESEREGESSLAGTPEEEEEGRTALGGVILHYGRWKARPTLLLLHSPPPPPQLSDFRPFHLI